MWPNALGPCPGYLQVPDLEGGARGADRSRPAGGRAHRPNPESRLVLPGEVGDAGGEWLAADGGVSAIMVVVVQPGVERGEALAV